MLPVLAAAMLSPWTLVWSDEFNGSGLADSSKWTYEFGYVRNKELQYYTVGDSKNARQEGGNLVIECRKDEGGKITSASLITLGKASWKYGRIEVKARIPYGQGSWPAIWMMGTDRPKVGWPKCGEIDIMENVGFDPNKIYGTVHWPDEAAAGKHGSKGGLVTSLSPWSDFHVYALEWSAQKLDFYYDDNKYFTFKNDGSLSNGFKFDKECYLLINFAFGGAWGGQRGVNEDALPLKYLIDYVRFYQKAEKMS